MIKFWIISFFVHLLFFLYFTAVFEKEGKILENKQYFIYKQQTKFVKQFIIFEKKNDKQPSKFSRFLAKYNYSTNYERIAKNFFRHFTKVYSPFPDVGQDSNLKRTQHLLPSTIQPMVENVALGTITALNVQTYPFYSFFKRIQEALYPYWLYLLDAFFEKNLRKLSRKRYITDLRVYLNSFGEVVRVSVVESSGIESLDNIAIKAFYDLSPFVNPPKKMLHNNKINMLWRFIVEIK